MALQDSFTLTLDGNLTVRPAPCHQYPTPDFMLIKSLSITDMSVIDVVKSMGRQLKFSAIFLEPEKDLYATVSKQYHNITVGNVLNDLLLKNRDYAHTFDPFSNSFVIEPLYNIDRTKAMDDFFQQEIPHNIYLHNGNIYLYPDLKSNLQKVNDIFDAALKPASLHVTYEKAFDEPCFTMRAPWTPQFTVIELLNGLCHKLNTCMIITQQGDSFTAMVTCPCNVNDNPNFKLELVDDI